MEHSHYQLSETWQFLNLVELGLFSIWWSMIISWFGGTWSTEIIFVEFSLSSIEWNNVNSQFSTNQRNKTLPQPINRGIFSWPCGFCIVLVTLRVLNTVSCLFNNLDIELYNNSLHGLSPLGGLVSPSGGFASLLFDQVEYFASIKLCQALSRQGAIIKIPVVRCHYLLWSSAQCFWTSDAHVCLNFWLILTLWMIDISNFAIHTIFVGCITSGKIRES